MDNSKGHVPRQVGEEEGREHEVEFARINSVILSGENVLNSAPRTKHRCLSQQLSVPRGKAQESRRCKSCGEAESSAEGSC